MDGLSFCRSVTFWGFSNNRAPRDKLTIHLLHVCLAKPLSSVTRLGKAAGLGWWRHKMPLWTRPTSFRYCLHQGKKSHCIRCLRSSWKQTRGQDAMWRLHYNINFQRTNLTMPFPDFKLLGDPGCPHKLTVRGRTGSGEGGKPRSQTARVGVCLCPEELGDCGQVPFPLGAHVSLFVNRDNNSTYFMGLFYRWKDLIQQSTKKRAWHPVNLRCLYMELCIMLCGSLKRRGIWGGMDTCMCMSESLHCQPETVTTLLIGSTPKQNKKLKKNFF